MPTFKYTITDANTYFSSPVPGNSKVKKHTFYCRAADMPEGVPSGCNPRFQNPVDRGIYKQIAESFCDKDDDTFALKNKGITVVAEKVSVHKSPKGLITLNVDIPEHLGDIDGHHTYKILMAHREENPEQRVAVQIFEELESEIPNAIPKMAGGLNTCVQVTTATMADQAGCFDEVKAVLKDKQYFQWIAFRDNQPNTSVSAKALVTMMWVCCPLNTEQRVTWPYSRSVSVYDHGFYQQDSEARDVLLTMTDVLPDLSRIYMSSGDLVSEYMPEQRKSPDARKTPEKVSVRDLCQIQGVRAFSNPEEKHGVHQLRETYRMLIMSAVRPLLAFNQQTSKVEWAITNADGSFKPLTKYQVSQHFFAALKNVFQTLVQSYRFNHGNHNQTMRDPTVWNNCAFQVEREVLKGETMPSVASTARKAKKIVEEAVA